VSILKTKILTAVVALAALGGIAAPSSAGGLLDTSVTIKVEGRDFSGSVRSPDPATCAEGRKVILFKQIGSEQDRSADQRVASDTASLNGDRYEWSTGNTGQRGNFYARVRKTAECKGDTSRTLHTRG
jgi:hypothetical protein